MRYLILTACFNFLIIRVAFCQFDARITDVDFRIDNNFVVVTYSITNYLPNQVFNIGLKFITADNDVIIPKSVTGAIGPGVIGGANKIIYWNVGNDLPEYQGMLKALVSVIVPVTGDPDWSKVQPAKKKEKGTGGPGYAFLSMILPGTGGYFVEKNTQRAIAFNVLSAAVLTSVVVHTGKLSDLEAQYDAASSTQKPFIQADIDKTQGTLEKATIAYAALWITDVLWVTFKGAKNQREKKQAGKFSLNYSDNQLMAGYRVTF